MKQSYIRALPTKVLVLSLLAIPKLSTMDNPRQITDLNCLRRPATVYLLNLAPSYNTHVWERSIGWYSLTSGFIRLSESLGSRYS